MSPTMFQLLGTILWSATSSAQQPRDIARAQPFASLEPGRNVALVIGVEQYADAGVADLSYAEDDAVAVARALTASGDYASEDVILMTEESSETLRPTLRNIYDQLARLSTRPVAGTVFVFFSGHGLVGGEEGAREYFVLPSDMLLSNPYKTGVRVQDVLDAMARVDAQHRVAIFDACRNRLESGEKGASRQVMPPDRVPGSKGLYVLYSTSFEEVSRELSPQQQELLGGVPGRGAFTYFLEQGLLGLADGAGGRDPDGVITATELYRFVSAGLERLPAREGEQAPKATCAECDAEMEPLVLRRRDMPELRAQSPIPSTLGELAEGLQRARKAYESGASATFLVAVQEVERRLGGLEEPLTPELAAEWHRVCALREWRLKDSARAQTHLVAAQRAAPWQAPRYGLPEDDLSLLALADRAVKVSLLEDTPVRPLPGLKILVDGSPARGWPEGRPFVAQGQTCLGEIQRTVLVEQGGMTPAFAGLSPLPRPCRWERARPWALGAGASLALAGGLYAGALATERAWDGLDPTEGEGEDDLLETQANRLGYAAQATAALGLGLGATTLAIMVRF